MGSIMHRGGKLDQPDFAPFQNVSREHLIAEIEHRRLLPVEAPAGWTKERDQKFMKAFVGRHVLIEGDSYEFILREIRADLTRLKVSLPNCFTNFVTGPIRTIMPSCIVGLWMPPCHPKAKFELLISIIRNDLKHAFRQLLDAIALCRTVERRSVFNRSALSRHARMRITLLRKNVQGCRRRPVSRKQTHDFRLFAHPPRQFWSQLSDSNRRPTVYKTVALPLS